MTKVTQNKKLSPGHVVHPTDGPGVTFQQHGVVIGVLRGMTQQELDDVRNKGKLIYVVDYDLASWRNLAAAIESGDQIE